MAVLAILFSSLKQPSLSFSLSVKFDFLLNTGKENLQRNKLSPSLFLSLSQAGTVWTNCWMVRDLNMPFGGMKASGIGREGFKESLEFFTEVKTICINHAWSQLGSNHGLFHTFRRLPQ